MEKPHTRAGLNRPAIEFVYKNHRGEIEERVVLNPMFVYATSPHHGEGDHWLLVGYDTNRDEYRDFKIDNILTPIRTHERNGVKIVEREESIQLIDLMQGDPKKDE